MNCASVSTELPRTGATAAKPAERKKTFIKTNNIQISIYTGLFEMTSRGVSQYFLPFISLCSRSSPPAASSSADLDS